MTIKYKDEDLSDEEFKSAVFNKDMLGVKLKLAKTDRECFDEEIALRLPQRKLEENLKEQSDKMLEAQKQLEDNYKIYERQVRTRKKEVPESYEKEEPSVNVSEEVPKAVSE
jgi:hypothetical protein